VGPFALRIGSSLVPVSGKGSALCLGQQPEGWPNRDGGVLTTRISRVLDASFKDAVSEGVKLFSLCLKTCRDHGYLFPVLKKPEDNDSGYETAIEFKKKVGMKVII
jgi:hypothetical protein